MRTPAWADRVLKFEPVDVAMFVTRVGRETELARAPEDEPAAASAGRVLATVQQASSTAQARAAEPGVEESGREPVADADVARDSAAGVADADRERDGAAAAHVERDARLVIRTDGGAAPAR